MGEQSSNAEQLAVRTMSRLLHAGCKCCEEDDGYCPEAWECDECTAHIIKAAIDEATREKDAEVEWLRDWQRRVHREIQKLARLFKKEGSGHEFDLCTVLGASIRNLQSENASLKTRLADLTHDDDVKTVVDIVRRGNE